MTKIKRPTRLIAYDTDENRERRKRGEHNVYHLVRPRTILYAAAIALTGAVMLYALLTRTNSHLSVLHVRAPLYTQTAEGGIRNGYTLRFSNKLSEPTRFRPRGRAASRAPSMTSDVAKPLPDGRLGVRVDPDATLEVPVYVSTPAGREAGAVDADHLHRHRRQERQSAASLATISSGRDPE